MRTGPRRPAPAGFISYVVVLSTGAMLTLLMIFVYRQAMLTQTIQANIQLQLDYTEKEDTILRSIVATVPNRAIRAMRSGSNVAGAREALTWQSILTDSLALANAGQSISQPVIQGLELSGATVANPGNSSLSDPARIFLFTASGEWSVPGINHDFGVGFPPSLNSTNGAVLGRDGVYPIIANQKTYGSHASGSVGLPVDAYPDFNRIRYPDINFGYVRPGEMFVAKRNWWSFGMNLGGHDAAVTGMVRPSRNFVLSIYEIPSQLAISASAFASLGRHSSGNDWENITVEGSVFASRAQVVGETAFDSLASRRSMELSPDAVIGGRSFTTNPFTPGLREQFEVEVERDLSGAGGDAFFPVSLPSEAGRAAFIPINRGADFFDRFSHPPETNTLSPTTWNNYSVGALQCAMRLDIVECVSDTDPTPTILRFSYIRNGLRTEMLLPQVTGILGALPPGFVKRADENQTFNFGDELVDVAYGANGRYYFQTGVKGSVTFNNARFGDPIVGTFKAGFSRPRNPFEIVTLQSGKTCVAVYPEQFPAFLARIGADGPAVNHSLLVNVDYVTSLRLLKPEIPNTELDYGVVMEHCRDLTAFTRGFSLVTNLRLYIGDDFNQVPTTPPAHYDLPGLFYPPTSLFAPEKRYGIESDAYAVEIIGQMGSLASESNADPVHLLDSVGMSGMAIDESRIRAQLMQIRHPGQLPPISMMNWLVVLEEQDRRHGTSQ